jgi:hypothetical protein
LPNQEENAVAFRALALTALLTRTQLEHGVQVDPLRAAGWKRIHDELAGWMAKEGIDAAVSPSERKLLDRPLGSWKDEEIFECVWRSEALTALLWTLSRIDPMPAYGRRVEEAVINPHIPALRPVTPWLESTRLRPAEALGAARRTAELWLWRARTEMRRRTGGKPPPGETYEATIAGAVEHALDEGILEGPVRRDLDVSGTAFAELEQAQFADAYSVSLERLFAMNWVCGYAEDWDETPTDT